MQRRRVWVRWSWVDLRLVPPALTVWVLTLATPGVPTAVLAALAPASAVCALAAVRWVREGPGRWTAVACLAGLGAWAAVAAVHAGERAGSPLPGLAARGTVLELALTVDEEPRMLAGGVGPARVLVVASVTAVDSGPAMRPSRVLVFGAAEDWVGVQPGTRVELRASPAPAEDGDDVDAVLSTRSPPTVVGDPGEGHLVAGDLRRGLADTSNRVLPPAPAGLLPGLVVGDTSGMDPEVTADFRRAGLGHLTAVSGANVAIVLGLLLWPLRRRLVDRRWQAVVGALGLIGYVVLARPSPSVLRAAAMGAVTLLALASGRSRVAVPALAAAVLVLLLVDPGLATAPGFALSVAATAGIVLLSPGWSRALRRRGLPLLLADALAVSAAAGLVTAPLVAGFSGLVSMVSLPANLLVAPAVAPATVLGLLATVIGPVSPTAADLLVWAAGWPTRWLVLVADRAAAVPDGAGGWPSGLTGALLLTGLLVGVSAVLVRWPRTRPLALAALVGVVVLGWPVRQVTTGWPVRGSVLIACDVGQGDALVLPTGPGEGVLVDTGPDPGLVDDCLRRLGITRLPLVLLSHLDADHAGGLTGALEGREVAEVATGPLAPTDDRIDAVERAAEAVGAVLSVLPGGERRTVGTALLEVLGPETADALPSADPNALSMVVRVTQHGLRLLLTGDLGADTEARMLRRGVDLRADVLKVPHHGSGDADPDFLAATGARVALISVGVDNGYGHPTGRLLDWLAADGMRVHRTDRAGDLAVVGSAEDWGVASRGPDAVQRAVAAPPLVDAGLPDTTRRRRGPGASAHPGSRSGRSCAGHRTAPPTGRRVRTGRPLGRAVPSAPRDTMRTCPSQHPRPPPRGCGSWSARRSCCGPGRSPPSAPRLWNRTRAPRSTS